MASPALSSTPPLASASDVAAIFDLDNTLIPGIAIELRFFRFLWRRGVVGRREALRSFAWLVRGAPPLSFHPLRERKVYLEGKGVPEVMAQAEDFVGTQVLPCLSEEGRRQIEAHRRAGHVVVLVTASLDFLVGPVAKRLNVDAVLAARPEQSDGRFTGRLLPPLPYGRGKYDLLRTFAASRGVALERSYAYGDSPGDLEVLQSVGHPQVVNPIRGMRRIARRRGWPTARWT
jgi:HAD superfamily hydrolase (TIGR01490 family)